MLTSYNRLRPVSNSLIELEALLDRYPQVHKNEIAEIGGLVARLSLIEEAILSSRKDRAEKLYNFRREHGDHHRVPTTELVAFLSFPILIAAALLWWAFA
ncbi:hypothetical protein [Sphingobium vermicomposti]|uniref:Uncharacterized protein n=1 Tax=Sphingobium vermicomposti TaxID=529005 RepID=A0A846MGT3_9SPHN|nr:hypothetical protein [Sphingobium vermicomposti]NIJ16296.1 hypothetical protein [Sphingobium vermicomposti]